MTLEMWQLKQRQSLPLEVKVRLTEQKIKEYINLYSDVYVAFSGGYGSTVLLDIARRVKKNMPALFINTGLELPEITQHVRRHENITTYIPRKFFHSIVIDHGWPVISKKVAMGFDRHRNTTDERQKELRLYGGINPTSGKTQHPTIPKKWHYLIDEDIKISDRCCYWLKKEPFRRYEKETNQRPIVGLMAEESFLRQGQYLRHGCIKMTGASQCNPLGFWTKDDLKQYTEINGIAQSEAYKTETRTGCALCLFGVHKEKTPNRIDRLKINHPKLYEYGKRLGIEKVLHILEKANRN